MSGFSESYRRGRPDVCEVCGSTHNWRRGIPAPHIRMDMAHMVARSELKQFPGVSRAFRNHPENYALLCQKCHAAFDCWLGVMGKSKKRKITERFEFYRDKFWLLLRRRDRMMLTLISLTAEDPHPDACDVKGGSFLNSSPIVGTPTEAMTSTPGQPESTMPEQTPKGGPASTPLRANEVFSCRPERSEDVRDVDGRR